MVRNRKIKVIAFDLDGTINHGDCLIEGADKAVETARFLGFNVVYLTNNSTKSRDEILSRLLKIGISATIDEIYSSGYAAAVYAKKKNLNNIFVSGSDGLIYEFINQGLSVTKDGSAECMVVGYNQNFTYDTLTECVDVAIHTKLLIACNKERTYPGKDGKIMPGCGAMISAIEWCAGRNADIVIGKPNTEMVNLILQKYMINPDELLVVGDTYESDILMAKSAGCPSILINEKNYPGTKSINSIKEIYDILVEMAK